MPMGGEERDEKFKDFEPINSGAIRIVNWISKEIHGEANGNRGECHCRFNLDGEGPRKGEDNAWKNSLTIETHIVQDKREIHNPD